MSACETHAHHRVDFVGDFPNFSYSDCPWCRIEQLDALVQEARPWIAEDTDALEVCHTPYDPSDEADEQVRLEVEARREWLRASAQQIGEIDL